MANQYPTLPRNATTPHFRRLLWRCGFSGSEKQIAHYRSLGLNGAIENLLAPRSPAKLSGPAPKVNGNPIAPANAWGHDTLWWLDRMVRSHNQLEERMTLSLHDHFATSNSGVGNTRHMLRQNKLLRSHAVGNFLDLVTRLTHDPAMLLWLNGADSNKWAPNENYARELMELFCLGNDPALEAATYGLWKQSKVYTQADIHAAALALTGWRYDWNKASSGSAAQQREPDVLRLELARDGVEDDLRAHGDVGLAGRRPARHPKPEPRPVPGVEAVVVLHPDAAAQVGDADDGRQLPELGLQPEAAAARHPAPPGDVPGHSTRRIS